MIKSNVVQSNVVQSDVVQSNVDIFFDAILLNRANMMIIILRTIINFYENQQFQLLFQYLVNLISKLYSRSSVQNLFLSLIEDLEKLKISLDNHLHNFSISHKFHPIGQCSDMSKVIIRMKNSLKDFEYGEKKE